MPSTWWCSGRRPIGCVDRPRRDLTVECRRAGWFNGRATTVVVANGQFLRGTDVVPAATRATAGPRSRSTLCARAPRRMRRRLPTGTHVPHPGVRSERAHRVRSRSPDAVPVEVDGRPQGRTGRLVVTLDPGGHRLLV